MLVQSIRAWRVLLYLSAVPVYHPWHRPRCAVRYSPVSSRLLCSMPSWPNAPPRFVTTRTPRLILALPVGPLWSAEHLTADGVARARGLERQGTFHEDERLSPDDRASLTDYERSGYDRGHMAPSGDMPDLDAQQQSFSLANVVPQTAALNREPVGRHRKRRATAR